MPRFYASYENSKNKNERLQRIPFPDNIWIAIDTLIMIMVTAGVVLLFTFVDAIQRFFERNSWVNFIIIGVSSFVLLIFALVPKVRSRPIGVYIMLSIVIALLSVGLAALLSPVGLKAGLISLACILVVEIPIVVLAMRMRRMSEMGLIVFNSITLFLVIVGVILSISDVFFEQNIIFFMAVAFWILFILFLLFTCVNNHDLIGWWMDFIAVEFTTAFIIWSCTICIFGLSESSLAFFFNETKQQSGL
ncbi:unnamed protein product [Trichobilharzia szidati]|nr:unnamed protein product [Trichobilharzia szidati]